MAGAETGEWQKPPGCDRSFLRASKKEREEEPPPGRRERLDLEHSRPSLSSSAQTRKRHDVPPPPARVRALVVSGLVPKLFAEAGVFATLQPPELAYLSNPRPPAFHALRRMPALRCRLTFC